MTNHPRYTFDDFRFTINGDIDLGPPGSLLLMTLRDLIFNALFNALKSANLAPGSNLRLASYQAVADHLVDCDADVAEACGGDTALLIPHIAAWRMGAPDA